MDTASDDSTVVPEPMKKETIESEHVEVADNAAEIADDDAGEQKATGVISEEWTEGVVALWKRSHGFISYKEGEESKRVFFHKSNVSTEDKKVHIRRGTEVRFHLEHQENGKLNAVEVQSRSGGPLNFHMKHGEEDTLYDRVMMFNEETFTGEVKFFSRLRGYGRINLSKEGVERVNELQEDGEKETVDDLYFKEIDMDVVAFPAKIGRNDKVQFKIFKSSRGYGAVHVTLEGGELIPEFTKTDKPAAKKEARESNDEKRGKRTSRNRRERGDRRDRDDDRRDNKKRGNRRERDDRRSSRRDRDTREKQRDTRSKKKRAKKNFEEIDSQQRFEGTVCAFNLHRFGFIKMNTASESQEMSKYGVLKNGKLCFRVQDIVTDQRPAMVGVKEKVKFSISRVDSGVLYAIDIRGEDEKPIICTQQPDEQQARKLLDEEWIEGTVKFFNWRRGHGRIICEGSNEEFYFHRNDLQSNDKVAGVEAGHKVACQKVDDPKGPAVTNICNTDKSKLINHLPRYLKKEEKKAEETTEEPAEETTEKAEEPAEETAAEEETAEAPAEE